MSKYTNVNSENIFLEGYDVLTYYSNAPKKGYDQFKVHHEGVTYLFSNAENAEKFKSDPESYLPEYGGFCATAASEGKLVPVDPENYKITDDRLFLFYKDGENDTLPQWNAEEEERKAKADEHWKNGTLEPMG
ncbi:MAG: YHS domain-containing (seleno)protein [Bacteroidota bacterium]